MSDNVNKTVDETMFKIKANESINKMLDCVLTKNVRTCKNCSDVNICIFLTEAVFAYRQRFIGSYHSTN